MTERPHMTAMGKPSGDRHRVVVIGSGFGGLFGTKALKRADVDITVIAKTDGVEHFLPTCEAVLAEAALAERPERETPHIKPAHFRGPLKTSGH